MKKRVFAMMLATALVLSVPQNPVHVHAEDNHVHTEEATSTGDSGTADIQGFSVEESGSSKVEEDVVVEEEVVEEEQIAEVLNADSLAAKLNNAQAGDVIVLEKGQTILDTSAEVKKGVTLLLPYAEGVTTPNSATSVGEKALYAELLIKEGVTLTVNGTVQVGAVTGESGNTQNIVTSAYSQITTEAGSKIVVNGSFDNYGYVTGDGELVANNGAVVSDTYTVAQFRGGSHILAVVTSTANDDSSVYPLNETGSGNLQITARYNYGSTMRGNVMIWANNQANYAQVDVIGANGIYNQGESGYIIKKTTEAKVPLNKEEIHFYNGGSLGACTLDLNFNYSGMSIKLSLSSANYLYPINGTTSVYVESGTFNVKHGFKFMPGSKMVIKEGASLTLSEEPVPGKCFFDGYMAALRNDPDLQTTTGFLTFYSTEDMTRVEANYSGPKYSSGTTDAELIVEGTLTLEDKGTAAGKIYTNNNGKIVVPCNLTESTFTSYESCTHGMEEYDSIVSITNWAEVETTSNVERSHNGTEVLPAVEPTCTKSGLTEGAKCAGCDMIKTKQEEIPALGHEEVVDEAVEATCTATGLTEGSHCSRCNEILVAQETVEMIPHTMVGVEHVEATCTQPEIENGYQCTVCGYVEGNVLSPALGHDEVIDEAVEATCTKTGLTEGKHCARCNEVFTAQEEVPALGHDEVVDEGKAATCTEAGLTEGRHCSRCNEVFAKQEEIPALGHTKVTDKAVAATCYSTGLTEGSHCSVCGKVFKKQETVAKTEHTGEWTNVKEATAEEDGLKVRVCSVCWTVEEQTVKYKGDASSTVATSGNSSSTGSSSGTGSSNGTGSSSGSGSSSGTSTNGTAATTGDDTNVTILLSTCVLALGVAIYIKRKKLLIQLG